MQYVKSLGQTADFPAHAAHEERWRPPVPASRVHGLLMVPDPDTDDQLAIDPDDAETVTSVPLPAAIMAGIVLVILGGIFEIIGVAVWLALIPAVVALVVLTRRAPPCPIPPIEVRTEENREREQAYCDWYDTYGRHFVFSHHEAFLAAFRRQKARERRRHEHDAADSEVIATEPLDAPAEADRFEQPDQVDAPEEETTSPNGAGS